MKKLMIGAAVSVLAGISAVAGVCDEGPVVECPFAYRIKVMVRTTKGEKVKVTENESVCYRKPSIRRFMGFVYGSTGTVSIDGGGCSEKTGCGCNGWENAELVMWDYDTRKAINCNSAKIEVLDLIENGKTHKVELTASVDGMKFSGFGITGLRDGSETIASINGFCAGSIPAGKCVNCYTCGDIVPSYGWELCGGISENECTSAYGKWTMTYDGEASGRYGAGYDLSHVGSDWEVGIPVAVNR